MNTNEPMTEERLHAIRSRVNAATSGPWGCYGDGAHEVFDAGEYDDGDPGELVAPVVTKLNDAVFIAHARTDMPALLAEVDRLRARPAVTEDMVERAARAMSSIISCGSGPWESLSEVTRDIWLQTSRAALNAAYGDVTTQP